MSYNNGIYVDTPNGVLYITEEEHYRYKKLISNILGEVYKRDYINNRYFVPNQKFDIQDDRVSIINKSIGNTTLIKSFCKNYNLNSFDELYSFINENKKECFLEGGKYFKEVHNVLVNCNKKGQSNTDLAINFIDAFLKRKNLNFKIYQTPPISDLDIYDGIDLVLRINDKLYNVQVKPLVSYEIINNEYKIISSGKLKEYEKVHLFIFVNEREQLFFKTKNLRIIDGIVYVPSENLSK